MNSYNFFITKLRNSEITPGMLNLEPCSGSIVVTDVTTGEVRALVSYPSYDNNHLTNRVDSDYYASLLSNNSSPLLNRSCQMLSAPGSTFKIVTTVAGVNEGVLGLDEFIADQGVFEKAYTKPQCWIHRDYNTNHGVISIPTAIDVSCNYFFYEVGWRLAMGSGRYNDNAGLVRLNKYASQFGLGEKSGIELDEAAPHLSDRDSVTSAIGQGTNLYAPVQMSKYITGIANNGCVYNLSILSRITDYNGNIIEEGIGLYAEDILCRKSNVANWDMIQYYDVDGYEVNFDTTEMKKDPEKVFREVNGAPRSAEQPEYAYGIRFVHFLFETYGSDVVKKLSDTALRYEFNYDDTAAILRVLKEATSDDVFDRFAKWLPDGWKNWCVEYKEYMKPYGFQ